MSRLNLLLACTLVLPLVQPLQWRRICDPEALCNDFTRAGYYIRRNYSSLDWLVFLEGGGTCYSAETCNRRYLTRSVRTRYGGGVITDDFDLIRAWNENKMDRRNTVSPLMTSIKELTGDEYLNIEGADILSTDKDTNPDFYHYNHILVPYCSSDLWLGDDNIMRFDNRVDFEFDPNATDNIQFIFKGFLIFHSVIREAILTNTTGTVLLSGSSAGGIGVLNHAKWVKGYLPNANIKVFTESSWFINFQDNIYHTFTDYTNISEESRSVNFNVTEFVMEQDRANGGNITSLYSVLLHHPPCTSIELGTPCCISAYCLIANSNYYPSDVPTLTAFGLFDVYLLAPSLQGITPFNPHETSFEVNFNNMDKTEPVGLNFNFLQTIGEYGGAMNSTLDITSHQLPHLSYYITSCLQHTYLATSSLWGEEELFGTNSFEFGNEVSSIRHNIKQNRWIKFKLTQLSPSGAIEYGVSLRDAVGIWLNSANSTNSVQFREACYLPHCNEMCPEEITFKQDESFLWEDQVKVLIYCVVATVTFICFVIKGLFCLWHWILLRKQKQFLKQSRGDVETREKFNQLPECEDKVSIACLDLRYSVPFNHNKHMSDDDVTPMVLSSITTDGVNKMCNGGSDKCSYANGGVTDAAKTHIPGYPESKKSENGVYQKESNKELFTATEVGDIAKEIVTDDKHKKKQEKVKVILEGISLYFNPGQLVAIMGPSGSGKTTFLDLLTGRRKYGKISGSIFVNGHRMEDIKDWYIANSGYVLQLAMPYYEELTVRENLTLAAQMRLPFSMREKFERIEQVMNEIGLQKLADTVVGGAVGAGLSGGQKKKLTIALQLLRLPSVIFLDEPTSGLDSASSYELLTYLNRLAGSQRTVIMTIHQPRMEIFHMFTRLIMLCEGKVAYHGTPLKAYEVFTTALKAQYLEKGLVLPLVEEQNPADVIMDMLGNSKMREAILQYYQQSGDPRVVIEVIKQSQEDNEMTDGSSDTAYRVFGKRRKLQKQGSKFTCMATLEARASLRTTIPQLVYLPVIFLAYGFLLGTVYIQTTSALLIVSGFCVYSVASALFMFPIMHTYYSQALTLYQLEHSDGIGHSVDLVMQGFARFVFLGLIPVILCGGILYLLVIRVMSYSLEVYLQVLVVNMALNQTWIALLIFVLCAFPGIAFRLSPVISSVAGFASGFFIPRESMPPWYRWLFFINPNYYGFSSTAYLLLKNFDSNCAGTEYECFITTGDYTLNYFNFNKANPAQNVMVLLVMTVGYLILAVVAMWIRHTDFGPAMQRLKAVFTRHTGRQCDFERWSKLESQETEDDSDPKDFGIEMTEIGGEIFSNSNEFLSDIDEDDEILFEDSDEVENSSLDQQVITDNSKNDSDNVSIREQYSKLSLPTAKETPEKLFSTCASDSDTNLKLAELLEVSNVSWKQQGIEKKISSISLPEGNSSSRPKQLVLGRKSNGTFGEIESLAKPQCKLQRRSTTHGVLQSSKHVHHSNRRSSLGLYNFLDDDECHTIWMPDNETTSSEPVQRKLSTPSTKTGIDSSVLKPMTWGHHEMAASSAMHGPGTPSDLRQKQKQLLERVDVAREFAKDQNITLVQQDVSHIVKRRSLRLSSRYVSFRMSKKRQQKNSEMGQSTNCEDNTQDVPSLAGPNNPSSKQKVISPLVNKTVGSKMSPGTSLGSKMLPANLIHLNNRKKPLLSEVNKSQSEYTLLSKSSQTAKKGALKACNSYTVIDTKPSLDKTGGVKRRERQDSAKTKYFVSKKIDSCAQMQSSAESKNCNNVLEFVPGENADCSEAAAPVHESVVAGKTSSNNSTSSGHDKGTVHTGSALTSHFHSETLNGHEDACDPVKATTHASSLSSLTSPLVDSSSSAPLQLYASSSSTSENCSHTNLISYTSSKDTNAQ